MIESLDFLCYCRVIKFLNKFKIPGDMFVYDDKNQCVYITEKYRHKTVDIIKSLKDLSTSNIDLKIFVKNIKEHHCKETLELPIELKLKLKSLRNKQNIKKVYSNELLNLINFLIDYYNDKI